MRPLTETINPDHVKNAETAKAMFIASKNPRSGATDWHYALRRARSIVAAALRASDYLRDVRMSLMENGGHMRVYRHFMAPPMSQDQFKLVCEQWTKGSENNNRPITSNVAGEVAAAFLKWRDPGIGRWLERGLEPSRQEVREVLLKIAPLIANQDLATMKRNQLANKQEKEVVDLLTAKGWKKLPSKLIDERAAVPTRHFMHKTRFATSTTASQEVDIACGLAGTYVTAMECKVTNDETNSVKRVNDIIKKAKAWQEHWGNFVVTAALLQGVVAAKDVQRLSDNNILVFWSHDLESFGEWVDSRS